MGGMVYKTSSQNRLSVRSNPGSGDMEPLHRDDLAILLVATRAIIK
jgi:hypothetical protein